MNGSDAEREIERTLLDLVQPVTRRILARYARVLAPQDAEDIAATVNLRLMTKLRSVHEGGEGIGDLESYVATTTYNLINDHLRRRFPERARLKNRLRYLFLHDSRFALWPVPSGSACGLSEWRGQREAADDLDCGGQTLLSVRTDRSVCPPPALRDSSRLAEACLELFRFAQRPLLLDAVVAFFADAWNVAGAPPGPVAVETVPMSDTTSSRMEARQVLRAIWREIRDLRPMQRKALLLNLRDNTTVNVTSLLVLTGTASYDELAQMLDMTPEELAAIWNDLPLDDLRIARLLDVTRQQVINLRKAARARLSRRLAGPRKKSDFSTS